MYDDHEAPFHHREEARLTDMPQANVSRDPYGGKDPREIPAYTIFDAARYLRIPENTVRNWTCGYGYGTRDGRRQRTQPLVLPSHPTGHLLSFLNVLELHMLDAIRRKHLVHVRKVRTAVTYLQERLGVPHPLADEDMLTDGVNLFVERYGKLISASHEGQISMKKMLEIHLERIDRDPKGLAIRLFPFTRKKASLEATKQEPRIIAIDPLVAFGRPVILGSRVATVDVAERYKAGDSIKALVEDYGCSADQIEEAIRCELTLDAA